MENPARTSAETDEMIHAAHASRFHWGVVGTPTNWGRGEWQVSRVYAVLRRAEAAAAHGERYLALCEEHALSPFDFGFAHEAIARAAALAGDEEAKAQHLADARSYLALVENDEDRAILEADLRTL